MSPYFTLSIFLDKAAVEELQTDKHCKRKNSTLSGLSEIDVSPSGKEYFSAQSSHHQVGTIKYVWSQYCLF